MAEQTLLSRRGLEARFRQLTGRTILGEIEAARLNRAKLLLEQTDYAIPKVAKIAGYNSAGYMIQVFRRHLSITPAKYRRLEANAGGAGDQPHASDASPQLAHARRPAGQRRPQTHAKGPRKNNFVNFSHL